jgi:hypothetical protein
MHTMTIAHAVSITGGLSAPSKMPGQAYGLPVSHCQTGEKMSKVAGSLCEDSSCYAKRNQYRTFAYSVEPAQYARLDAVELAIASPEYRAAFIAAFVRLIGADEYFRWHDAGDLQSWQHLALIADVARATPATRHWLPTREYSMVREFLANGGTIPPNLIVRLSAMFPDQPAKIPASLSGVPGVDVSNVHKHARPTGRACPASTQGNECRACRACWKPGAVSYLAH